MRLLNGLLCSLMILFAAVQWNDPDGLFWAAIYAVPAGWAAVAAFRPRLLGSATAKGIWAVLMVSYLAATIYFWPTAATWWRIDVWWENEPAREGMGLMIATLVLAIAGASSVVRLRSDDSQP